MKDRRRLLVKFIGTASALLIVCASLVAQPVTESQTKAVDAVFAKWNRSDSPGCVLAIMQDGHIVYKHAYGMADLEHNSPISPQTPFHVASVSKQFTAAAVILLAEDGKLSLDDEIHKYIPELPRLQYPITISNLLHHSSGLRDQWDLLELAGWRYSLDLITNDDVFSVLTRQKELNFRPGERFLYSNTGYTLLGEIVKRVSGESLRNFTTERMFKPLGMNWTHFRDDHAELIHGQAYGYQPVKSGSWRLSVTNFDTVGATSLFTTVEDLFLWDENFYQHRIGGPFFSDLMLRREHFNDGRVNPYAMGLIESKYRGLTVIAHAGSDAGYRAYLVRFPELHFSVACLCNAGPSADPVLLSRTVADVFLDSSFRGAHPSPPQQYVDVPTEQLRPKAGLYWNGQINDVMELDIKDGKLSLLEGDELLPLQAFASDRFFCKQNGAEIRFEPADSQGKQKAVVIRSTGESNTYDFLPSWSSRSDQLNELAGDYLSDEIDPIYRLASAAGKLTISWLKHSARELKQAGPDLFYNSDLTIQFVRDPHTGAVSGFVLSTGRIQNMKFRKSPMTRE